MSLLNDGLSVVLKKQMDACTLRQKVIASNVANSNTPGFKKSQVNFQQHLKYMLDGNRFGLHTTNARHLGAPLSDLNQLSASVNQVPDTMARAGGNNVDPDEEMVNLATNSILYNLTTRANSDKSNLTSYVIKGGK